MKEITTPTVRRLRAVAAKAITDSRGRHDDEAYRALLMTGFGVRSTKDLSEQQGKQIIADLLSRNPRRRPDAPARTSGPRYVALGGGYATQRQLNYVAGLETNLGWQDQPERLRGWIRRQLRLPESVELLSPASLTPQQCRKVLTGLEAMRDEGRQGDRPRADDGASSTHTTMGPVAGASTRSA